MKKILVAFTMFAAVLFSTNTANAQTDNTAVNNVVGGLLAVAAAIQVGDVNVDVNDVITIGDVTITDVVNVKNVLNNADIEVLTDFLITIDIDDTLNNLLRNADVLSNNQVVVGILSGGQLVIQNLNQKPKKK